MSRWDERICVVCGNPFWPRVYNQLCCCRTCTLLRQHALYAAERDPARHQTPEERTCPVCGVTFTPRVASGQMCCDRCRRRTAGKSEKMSRIQAKDERTAVARVCLYCGRKFETKLGRRYCSRTCQEKHRYQMKGGNQ